MCNWVCKCRVLVLGCWPAWWGCFEKPPTACGWASTWTQPPAVYISLQWAGAARSFIFSHWQGWVRHSRVAPLVLPWVNRSACVIQRDSLQTSSHCNWCAKSAESGEDNLPMPVASFAWSLSLLSLLSAAPSRSWDSGLCCSCVTFPPVPSFAPWVALYPPLPLSRSWVT